MIQWEAPSGVVERWQPELDRIAPREDRGHSWFELRWEPGEWWSPIERWYIWETWPATPARTPLGIWEDLHGPNPRWFGRYDETLNPPQFVRSRSFAISQRQWLIYRETRCFARPVWVCQGRAGGHRRYWSSVESNLSQTHGGPMDPPEPGSLCYAEPDARTIARIADMDLVRRFGDMLKLGFSKSLMDQALTAREKARARLMAQDVCDHQDEVMGEAMTFTRDQWFRIWESGSKDAPYLDKDEEKERFVDRLAAQVSH